MVVNTVGGNSCRLLDTCLSIGDIPLELENCISFLDVPDPSNPRWQHLSSFGVSVKQDISFWLRCLENISQSPCKLKQVTYFYEQIQARCNEDKAKVQ